MYVNNNLSKFGNLRFLAANTFADAWNKAEAGYTYFIDITGNTDSPITTANRWFGQIWKNDTGKYGWQVAWSFNGTIYKRERNNSDAWTDWGANALKSDLSDLVIEKGFQKSVDIPAGNAYATIECDIEYTVPSGYKALDIVRGIVPNATCCVYNVYLTGGKARLVISNLNGSRKNVTAYAFILFIKS